MADDFDIDGMLEATFKKAKEEKKEVVAEEKEKKSKSHKRSSRDRSKSSRKSEKKHRSRSRRSRSRSRKRSRSRRSRSRDRKHRRRSSRSRSRDRKRRSRSRDRRRSSRERIREKTPDGPAPSEDDRDERTVFCMQLSQRIRSHDLEEFFSAVGKVREVKLIADKHSKRSKGIAYVEFRNMESVPLALGLNGQKLLGVPIIVQPTQSEKNKVAAANSILSKASQGPTKLYVGNLHENISEEMLKAVFNPFGRVDLVQIIRDNDTNASKGYAFITFAEAQQAKQALDQLQGFDIAGRPIRLNTVSSSAEVSTSALGGPGFLDNDAIERNGIDLGTTGRLQLMAKLAEGTGLKVPSSAQHALMVGQSMGLGLQGAQHVPGANPLQQPPIATNCFQLTNMFDPKKETQPGWDAEIRDDVIEECSRHGDVHHVHVEKNSPNGVVFVKCASLDVAAKSVASLHGRYFSGNMITANYVPLQGYNQMFPQATFATAPLKK